MNSDQDKYNAPASGEEQGSSTNSMRSPRDLPDFSQSNDVTGYNQSTRRMSKPIMHDPGARTASRRQTVSRADYYQKDPDELMRSRRYRKARRKWHRRISGYPRRSQSYQTVPELLWSSFKKGLKILLILFLLASVFIGGLGVGVLSGYVSATTPLEIIDLKSSEGPTVIYDSKGKVVQELTGADNVNREYVSITRVKASYLDEAFIAIEDERFEDHNGIDPKRIVNAVGSLFLNAGNASHGASTITQQVVKMMSGADERSAQRKVQEWQRALELERRLSKDAILELFVNMVPMANGLTGVQAAAKTYFDKDVSELDLAESAFLAGIPNLPSIYNPLTEYGRRNAMRRMRIILSKMYELDKISQEEYNEALNRELIFKEDDSKEDDGVTSYFVDAVVNEVIEQLMLQRGYSYALAQTAVFQHGLTIETTMDQDVQSMADSTFLKQELFATNPEALQDIPEPPQAAITIISNEPATRGEVVALVGGFGEKKKSFVFNRATQAYRQPGSSIKPVLVYAPAVETGTITAASIFKDEPKYLDPQNPDVEWPVNVTREHYGLVTARTALQQSYNTIAVEIYTQLLNPSVGLSYLRRLGIDRTNEQHPSGALGAFSQGVTTMQMAGAYAALANEGFYTEPILFRRVLDADGNVLLENKPRYDQVFSAGTATVMTSILEGTLMDTSWITPYAKLPDQVAAGKTGTTSDQIDVWFCGYTPYYTASVWYGFDNANGRRTTIEDADSRNAIRIWQDVMSQLHENKQSIEFQENGNISYLKICKDSGLLANEYCPHTYLEIFDMDKGNAPQIGCTLHQKPKTEETEPEPDSTDPGENEETEDIPDDPSPDPAPGPEDNSDD